MILNFRCLFYILLCIFLFPFSNFHTNRVIFSRRFLLGFWTIKHHGERRGCKLTFGQGDRSAIKTDQERDGKLCSTESHRDVKEKGKKRGRGDSLSEVLRITFFGQIEISFFNMSLYTNEPDFIFPTKLQAIWYINFIFIVIAYNRPISFYDTMKLCTRNYKLKIQRLL